ncbi:MAG: large Ala/Glu-rich protein, partial [Labilithrix sp.]|nr:large Ala/Glu-rich protein [Labilithrix sp.]
MADETHEVRGAPEGQGRDAPGRNPTIFVADAAAESVRIADTLRTTGYLVVAVQLDALVIRSQVQRPNVVLVDVDSSSALDEIARLRRLPGAGAIDFVYFGSGDGPIRTTEDAISNDGSAFFKRPIDLGALVRRLEALTGGPTLRDRRL